MQSNRKNYIWKWESRRTLASSTKRMRFSILEKNRHQKITKLFAKL